MRALKNCCILLMLIFTTNNCRTESESEETVRFSIENKTNSTVSIFIYSLNDSGERSLIYDKTSNGPGTIWERNIVIMDNEAIPVNVITGDLAVLVFDNSRREEHTMEMPERTMFNTFVSFSGSGNNSVYSINEENFNNAVPCDGPCN